MLLFKIQYPLVILQVQSKRKYFQNYYTFCFNIYNRILDSQIGKSIFKAGQLRQQWLCNPNFIAIV